MASLHCRPRVYLLCCPCARSLNYRQAFVIGSGPNGLTAAIILAKAGLPTTVLEAQATFGGGARSSELTLPGFAHDICSAVHPLAVTSPVFAGLPLRSHGLEWIHPPIALAHPFDDGSATFLYRSLKQTADGLGQDGPTYARIVAPFAERWTDIASDVLQPLFHVPRHPFLLAKFGLQALLPATFAAKRLFQTSAARAFFAGIAAHSVLPLDAPGSAAFGWILAAAAHRAGWPIPRGGSQQIANTLAACLTSHGGRIVTHTRVRSLHELPDRALILCDVAPRQFLAIAGARLPASYRRQLQQYRYGPGVFKIDWALDKPVQWKAPACAHAGTLHLGGSFEEIAVSEKAASAGWISERPFVLFVQPSLFDPSRAPAGHHTAWAYCHVPNGSTVDMTSRLEAQVERFAPGFTRMILARHTFSPAEMETHNANLIGGDISGGANDLLQLAFRPTRSLYRTPLKNVYLCSASTPPGGGVHGMCGYNAARMALRDAGIPTPAI